MWEEKRYVSVSLVNNLLLVFDSFDVRLPYESFALVPPASSSPPREFMVVVGFVRQTLIQMPTADANAGR